MRLSLSLSRSGVSSRFYLPFVSRRALYICSSWCCFLFPLLSLPTPSENISLSLCLCLVMEGARQSLIVAVSLSLCVFGDVRERERGWYKEIVGRMVLTLERG